MIKELFDTEVLIKLEKDSHDVQMYFNKNNISTTKIISIESLISSFKCGEKTCTGILPRGTRFFSGEQKDYIIGIEIPRSIRSITYIKNGVFKYEIPFPICFFIFVVLDNIIQTSSIYSLKNSMTSEKDILYNFPFGNAYSSGSICWGGVSVEKIKSPIELTSIISLFLGSEYNGDLISSSSFRENSSLNIRYSDVNSLFKALDKKDFFPNELLSSSIQNLSTQMR